MTTLDIPRASTTAKTGYKNFRNTLLEDLNLRDYDYAEAEGFDDHSYYREGVMAAAFKLDRNTGKPVAKKRKLGGAR